MKKIIFILSLFFLTYYTFGQQKSVIQGKVLDVKTKEAIPFVNVYLEGSTIGTEADLNGNFVLKNIPDGHYRLVASMIGFVPSVQTIVVANKTISLEIALAEDIRNLQEVKVVGSRDKVWKKQFKAFEIEFLGKGFNNKEVKILNKEILDFTTENNILRAKASKPIEIENRTLGYKISYNLQDFEKKKETTSYKGLVRFEVLEPKNTKEENNWKINRLKAYQGSLNHFLKAFIDNKLAEEGFDAFFINPQYTNNTGKKPLFYDIASNRHIKINPKEIITETSPNQYTFQFKYPIELVYNKQRVERFVFIDAPHPYSTLIPKSSILVSKNGNLQNPYAIEMGGKMGEKSMSELLPRDYSQDILTSTIAQESSNKKTPASVLLKEISDKNQDQKVYIHTDKSAYFAGDTLRYKAYIVDATSNQLVSEPQKLFVEILTSNSIQSLILQAVLKSENGTAWSNFVLPDTLATGTYFIKSYTNWMRNANYAVAFQKEIQVQGFQNYVKKDSQSNQIKVQFFPEGGQYLWGVPARMGVKITNNQGKIIIGELVEKNRQNITKFSTNALGIGSFLIKNDKNNPTKALINGIEYALPEPQERGFSMMADNSNLDSLLISVFHSSSKKTAETLKIIVQSKGLIYEELSSILDKDKAQFYIKKQDLPTGVYQITIFNEEEIPQAERLVYIQNNEKNSKIDIEIDNEKLNLQLVSSEENFQGEFSMSINDASKISVSNSAENMYSYMLLSSELKGKIENPSYYFENESLELRTDLDNLLLTQGWRRYKWEDILENNVKQEAKHKAFEGINIAGKVLSDDKDKQILADVELIFMPINTALQAFFSKTDKNGKFLLENVDFHDSTIFIIKVLNQKGKEIKANIELEQNTASLISKTESSMNEFKISIQTKPLNEEKYLPKNQEKLLNEVIITTKKTVDYDHDSNGNTLWKLYDKPDGVINVDEKTVGSNIIEMIQARIPAIRITGDGASEPFSYSFRGSLDVKQKVDNNTIFSSFTYESKKSSSEPLFLLDGVVYEAPTDFNNPLMYLNRENIERIDYLVNEGTSIYGVRGGAGVIAIYSKRGGLNKNIPVSKLQVLKLKGFDSFKEFYNTSDEVNIKKPQQAILLWNPSFRLANNQTTSIAFVNKIAPKLLITIEGISDNGKPFSIIKVIDQAR